MQGTATTTLFEEPHRPGKVYPAGARYPNATQCSFQVTPQAAFGGR